MNVEILNVQINYNDIIITTKHISDNILGNEYKCDFDSSIFWGKMILICTEVGLIEDKFVLDTFNSRCVEHLLLEIRHEFKEFSPEQIEYWLDKCGIYLHKNVRDD